MTKVTPEIRERMMKLWKEDNLSCATIAKRFDVSPSTVNHVICRMNAGDTFASSKPPTLTSEQKAEILRLRSEGLSYNKIKKHTGVPASTVRYVIKKATKKEPAATEAGQAHIEMKNTEHQ